MVSKEEWISVENWRTCGDPSLKIEDFAGDPCWIGMDLAEKSDIAALCLVFKREKKYHLFFRFYLNEYQVQKPQNQHLLRYEREGHLIVNEGNATDFDVILEDMKRFHGLFDVREVPYDPKFAAYFAAKLIEAGLPMVEIIQTSSHFTLPIIETENLVLTGDLVHDANPAMDWMISNVVMRISKFSGLKHPTKEKHEQKIDGPVSMLMAMGRAMLYVEEASIDDFINTPISG
jgi:phage terminase large subunit-like protein